MAGVMAASETRKRRAIWASDNARSEDERLFLMMRDGLTEAEALELIAEIEAPLPEFVYKRGEHPAEKLMDRVKKEVAHRRRLAEAIESGMKS